MNLSGIVLVTGGAGFVGSHIAARLAESGARVRVLDNLATGHLENLEEIGGDIVPGVQVLMKKNHQVGEVQEIRGKKAVVKIGLLPMQVDMGDLVVVRKKETE